MTDSEAFTVTWLDHMNGKVANEAGEAVAVLSRRPAEYGPGSVLILDVGDGVQRGSAIGSADSDPEVIERVGEWLSPQG